MNKMNAPRAQRGMSTIEATIAVAVGAIGMVFAIVLLVQYAVTSYGTRDVSGESAMSHEAIVARLKPVGDISMYDPSAPQPVAAAMPVAATAGAAAGDKGENTYKAVCTGCHAAGVLGSPKYGDKVAWAPRIAQGMETLYSNAIKGKNSMPAKGGNPALADDDIKAAVQFMVKAAK